MKQRQNFHGKLLTDFLSFFYKKTIWSIKRNRMSLNEYQVGNIKRGSLLWGFTFFIIKKNLIIFFRAINNTQRTKIKQKNTYADGKFSISQVMLLYWRQTFDKQYFSFFILLYHVNFSLLFMVFWKTIISARRIVFSVGW